MTELNRGAANCLDEDTMESPHLQYDWNKTVEELMELFGQQFDRTINVESNVENLVQSFSIGCAVSDCKTPSIQLDTSNITEEHVLQSIILLSDDWNVLGPSYSITKGLRLDSGKFGLSMKEVCEEDYVGVLELNGVKGLEVYLNPLIGFLTLLVVPRHGSWQKFDRPLDAKCQIEDVYRAAFSQAKEKLSRVSEPFRELVTNAGEDICSFPINDAELQIFGPCLLERINHGLDAMDLVALLKMSEPEDITNYCLNMPVTPYSRNDILPLNLYNLNNACDIILTMKKTCKPDQSTLLWKGDGILEANANGSKKYAGEISESYPLLIGGHGSYKIQRYKEIGYKEKHLQWFGPSVVSLELDANPFHAWDYAQRWKTPFLESALVGFPIPKHIVAYTCGILRGKEWLRDNHDWFAENKARCTVVVRSKVSGALKNLTSEVILDSFISYVFGKIYTLAELRQHFSILPPLSLISQVENTLVVATNTQEHLFRQSLKREDVGIDLIVEALVSEVIMGHVMHGRNFGYNEDLVNALNLNPSALRKKPFGLNGLDGVKDVMVKNGILIYVGNFAPWQQAIEFPVVPKPERLGIALTITPRDSSCPEVTRGRYFHCLAAFLWENVSEHGRIASNLCPENDSSPEYFNHILGVLKNESFTCCTSFEFVDMLFVDPGAIQEKQLRDAIRDLKTSFKDRRHIYEMLKFKIAAYFDTKIFESNCLALLYPDSGIGEKTTFILVLPFAGNEQQNFYEAGKAKARMIMTYYKTFAGMPDILTHEDLVYAFDFNLEHRHLDGFPKTIKYFVQQLKNALT